MIRLATTEDLDQLLAIEAKCLPRHWQRKDFLYELNINPYAEIYVYQLATKVIGFIDFWQIFERAEIASLAVDCDYQGKGYGKELLLFALKSVEKKCENCFLEVRPSNATALALYRKLGFMEWRRKRDYYQDNHEDALEMICILGGNYGKEDFSTGIKL